MRGVTRRSFLSKSLALGAALTASGILDPRAARAKAGRPIKDDISLAQWALVEEVRQGKWKTIDFAKIARQDFDLNGIEFVNTLMEVPTAGYLARLKKNAADHNVKMVLIMVDGEGETCTPSKEERIQTVINHRKWIDVAHTLGCRAIRTNCRGPEKQKPPREESLKWAAETYNMMLEYAVPAKIQILIENHGGVSNDADWMVSLMDEVDSLYFGSYPDWRSPSSDFDNHGYLLKMLPYAGGMSYRNQPTEEGTAKLIKLCRGAGYRGWYGIESSGREGIIKGKELLEKYLYQEL